MTPGIPASAIEQIIEDVFVQREISLEDAAQPFDVAELCVTISRFRKSMITTLSTLPDAAFHNRADGAAEEIDWSAGQIVSHNTDRLIWVLRQIALLIGTLRLEVPHSLERMVRTAPFPLSRDESLAALEQSSAVLERLFAGLQSSDVGKRAASDYHGEMSAKGWLLLQTIHDYDHSNQLMDRHERGI